MNKRYLTNNVIQPKLSKTLNFIKINFPDITISQCEYEGYCGLTFIRCDTYMKCYKEIRGGCPGNIDFLSNNNKNYIAGINIAGGSTLGLESTCGIISESRNFFKYECSIGAAYNGAIIFSQNMKNPNNKIYPDIALGKFAFNNNSTKLYNGQAGAGVNASHGQGWSYNEIDDIKILVLCVNNASGIVYKDNKPISYPSWSDPNNYYYDGDFSSKYNNQIKSESKSDNIGTENTTIIVIITNLDLDIHDLQQMNNQVNCTIGEYIKPFNTFEDGDILYTCSTSTLKKNIHNQLKINLYIEISNLLKEAIFNSIIK